MEQTTSETISASPLPGDYSGIIRDRGGDWLDVDLDCGTRAKFEVPGFLLPDFDITGCLFRMKVIDCDEQGGFRAIVEFCVEGP
jgi:hypothetical protein